MTWINRLRLLGGMLAILALVAALTLIFNQRQTQAASDTATIQSTTFDIGPTFSGTVTKQYVATNATVAKGDRLCKVQSPSLRQEISNGLELSNSAAYDVHKPSGTLTYKATASGELTSMECKLGTPVSSGKTFAKISAQNSQFVVARYVLTPRDYERVQAGARASVLLPNNVSIDGTVTDIRVATDEFGNAQTQVRVAAQELRGGKFGNLATPGTPVVTTLELRDDGPLAGLTDATFNFLRQIGIK